MLESNTILKILDTPASPAILAGILGCNVSLIYQHSQMGRLPTELSMEETTNPTYLECIHQYIQWYKKNQDLKLEKEKNEQELRLKKAESKRGRGFSVGGDENEGMPPLMAAKIRQEIKLNLAREEQIVQKTAIERGEYIASGELLSLCAPFTVAIRDMLLTIALDFPETQKKIDQCMENLQRLGTQLIEGAEVDSEAYVESILNREVDLEDI